MTSTVRTAWQPSKEPFAWLSGVLDPQLPAAICAGEGSDGTLELGDFRPSLPLAPSTSHLDFVQWRVIAVLVPATARSM
jgi:hypothetical protein